MTKETDQLSFMIESAQADNQPVVCLGMTFKNDEERKLYFQNELRKKLPELRDIEGFPIGNDEDIIALSDPPYYTACPNPWINDFIEEWEQEKVEMYGKKTDEEYNREPFAADVTEGKNDPIYYAHSYHTKVPHKAIMRYMLNYTNPGDIILDGFSGTGMTGVASQLCGDKEAIQDLGLYIDNHNLIYDEEKNCISELGSRKTILNDLSPTASFISKNYNLNMKNFDVVELEMKKIMDEVFLELKKYYETAHVPEDIEHKVEAKKKGIINYIIWSDVFLCSNCQSELVFFEVAVEDTTGKVKDNFDCPYCKINLSKRSLNRVYESSFDNKANEVIQLAKQVPVLINYTFNKKRFNKKPDALDLELIDELHSIVSPYWYPTNLMPKGYNTAQPLKSHGYTHVHHFYTKRNLVTLAAFFHKLKQSNMHTELLFILSSIHIHVNKMRRYQPVKPGGTPGLPGTLFVSSLNVELSIFDVLPRKLRDIKKASYNCHHLSAIGCGSATSLSVNDNSVDYIFTDPPFGSNLMYSELNFIWESWLRVQTNNQSEAIVNNVQQKELQDYQHLMEMAFKEYYRVIKPGHWMTVEFSNSQATVWNSIQESIQKAGFIIANVSALDKKFGSFKAVTSTTAVKQDLVISAYKPRKENIEKMKQEQNTEESAWTFVKQHLEQLPVFIGIKGEAQIISERTPRILFDRMVAYHVQNGLPVPISSGEFQVGVAQRFPMRDGMAFLEKQVAEYDKKRILVKEFAQMSLFVSDETSAIEWIRQQLLKKPQTRQDLHPSFMKEIQHIAKHEMLPELDDLLYQNFLRYDGEASVPDQIASYLRKNYKDLRGLENDDAKLKEKALNRWYVPDPNKQADLEKLREKSLLREFEGYIEELEKSKKKLKQFRTEAIRAGFKKAWSDKDYQKIVTVGDRLPESVIQEDDKLLMYYDNAQIRLGL
ncbi:DNA methyltransferase [Neobacillus citreus]|uniref:DNA methylase n=1 Tax=Neobacillus citreus TaxID=2833578 RepID=A0A942T6I6_9BACI|nr:DNA methyltransferase [Neobacillus citreus]MCH6265332.1 site-specific DNA-methyltransferase [Neobacillus citreus]